MNKQKRVIAFSLIAGAIPSFFIGANYSNQPAMALQPIVGVESYVCLPGQLLVKIETPKVEAVETPKPLPNSPKPLPSVTPEEAPRPMPSIVITDTMEGQ